MDACTLWARPLAHSNPMIELLIRWLFSRDGTGTGENWRNAD